MMLWSIFAAPTRISTKIKMFIIIVYIINLFKYNRVFIYKIFKEYLNSYFDYYNNERLNLSIGEMTPAEKEKIWFESHKNDH